MQFEEFADEYFGEKEDDFKSFADKQFGTNGKGFEGFATDFLEAQKVDKRFEEAPPPEVEVERPEMVNVKRMLGELSDELLSDMTTGTIPKYMRKKPVVPERREPEITAMTPKELAKHERARPAGDYPKFAKFIDPAGQFITETADSLLWRAPGKIVGGKPAPLSPLAETLGGAGSLVGMIGGSKTLGLKSGVAPFAVMGKVWGKAFNKPAKTIAGTVVQNILKNMLILGSAEGLTTHEGENVKENLAQRLDAVVGGAGTGAVFGGAQFAAFKKFAPSLARVLRVGSAAVALDVLHGQRPWDDRNLMQKVYDYGLTAVFTWRAQTPRMMQAQNLFREGLRANEQLKKEGMEEIFPKTMEELLERAEWEATKAEPVPEGALAEKPTLLGRETGGIPKEVLATRLERMKIEAEGRKPEEIVPEESVPPTSKKALLEQAREAHEKGIPRKELPEEVRRAVDAEEDKASVKRLLKEIEAEERGEPTVSLAAKALEEVERKRPVAPRVGEPEREPSLPLKPAELEPERPPTAKPAVEEAKIPAIEKEPAKKPDVGLGQKTNEELESMVKYGAQKEKAQAELDRRYLGEAVSKEPEEIPDFVFEEAEPIKPAIVKEPVSRQEAIKKATARKPVEPVVEPEALLKQTEAYLLEKGIPRENWGAIIDRVKKKGFDPSKKEPLENYLAKTVKYFEEGQPRGRGPTKAGPREEQVFEGREKEREEPVSRKQITAEETAWREKELSPEEIYEAKERKRGTASAIKKSLKKLNPEIRAVAEGVMKGEPIEDMAGRMKVSHTTVRSRIAEMAEAMSKDPELRKYAEENIEAAEKAKDGKNIPLLRKYAGLDPGSIDLRSLPPAAQNVWDWGSEVYRKIGKEFIWNSIRLPQWSSHYEALTKREIDIESESHRVTEKAYRMAWDFLKDKNKENYHKAIEAEEELGSKLTDVELKQVGLSPQQVKNYKGARRATDFVYRYSIMLMRKAGVPENKAEAEKRKWKGTTIAEFKENRQPVFWPHRRFGNWAVFLRAREDVIGRKGPRIEFTAHEKKSLALKHVKDLQEQGRKNKVVVDGVEYALFKRGGKNYKVPMYELNKLEPFDLSTHFRETGSFIEVLRHLPVLEHTLKRKGIEFKGASDLAGILGKEYLSVFAKGAFARRADVPGWSKDYARAFKEYLSAVPFALAKRYYRGELEDIFNSIPADKQTYAKKMISYFMGEENYEGRINQGTRRFIYNFFLGAKPAFAVLNLTQRLQTTVPMAQAEGGVGGIFSVMKAQVKETQLFWDYAKSGFKDLGTTISQAKFLSVAEKRVLKRMFEAGELGAARQKDIIGIEMKKEPGKGVKQKASQALEFFGFASERSNRISSALTSVDISTKKGIRNVELLIDSARDFTGKTQWLYSKATRMQIARGTFAPLFMFKSFINNYAHMQVHLFKNNKPAFVTANAIMLGLAGLGGHPAYKVVTNTVASALRAAGWIKDDEELMKQVHDFEKEFKESGWIGEGILKGFVPALGLEGAWMFGAGEILDLAPKSILDSFSYFMKDMIGAKGKNIDMLEAFARISPTELKHLLRWYQVEVKKQMPSGITGKPRVTERSIKRLPKHLKKYGKALFDDLPSPEDISKYERALYAMGFPTKEMARYTTEVHYIKKLAGKERTTKAAAHEYIGKVIANLNISPKAVKKANAAWYKINLNRFLRMMDEDTRNEVKRLIAKYEKKDYPLSAQAILDNIKDHI